MPISYRSGKWWLVEPGRPGIAVLQVIEITNRGFPTVVALLLVTAAYVVAVIAVGRLQGKSLLFDPVKLTAGLAVSTGARAA